MHFFHTIAKHIYKNIGFQTPAPIVYGQLMDVFSLRDDPPENPSLLLDREAHVWLLNPEAPGEELWRGRLTGILPAEERERANRFIFEKDRRLFTVAHAGLRSILSKYSNIPPRAWQFAIGEHGRPEISPGQNKTALRFNISHCRGLVACIINRQYDCGVDVEQIGRVRDAKSLAEGFFSRPECDALEKCQSEAELRQLFCRYWTLKEAYIKARGAGLIIPLSNFHFTFEEGQIQIHFAPDIEDREGNWQLYQQMPTAEHMLAVALKPGEKPGLEIKILDYQFAHT